MEDTTMDVYQMQLVKVGPSLREWAEQLVAGKHHKVVVNRLRRFREGLEEEMTPEPWTVLEAPAVTFLADICNALHLTANEKAEVLGTEGQQAQDNILAERVLPQRRLNERQQQALAEVQQRGYITNGDLRQAFPQVTAETLRLDLVDLVQRGLLRRQGRCRGTVYTAL
jgi:predicted HTH transcriptional regulator